ncbi:peptidase M20 [Pseudoclavibacter endophyticus]|uniref:M20/M25/M40 family metallo-hydrolase n=1 Tax=Pseudoclavibacter endophyticus TaxID=1778590 RepID=A0A6H9WVH3_9MICO|nr:M20/M25/M40 family metallo-hydrolase [Pseudoclavibacter endophyticus]KAB1650180.1 M20/M25/M40 family metallo-hydrolase [Pseudoclavibacter endophyticus]GGA56471.1 peptidase M20 [Pseudoclavibacter endophyticus]
MTDGAVTQQTDLSNDRTVRLTQELIRIDTTNYGEGRSKGEEPAAELLAGRLEAMGLDVIRYDTEPGRRSIVTRVPGRNRAKPALVVHGHTDVVPADPAAWSVDPFAGVIRDGMLWGRGAVDMKDMNAMIVTALEDLHAAGQQPERELIVAFFADEENVGVYGARPMVRDHPEYFAGATEAISEVGGYSITVANQRAYLVQTGEKAIVWIKLHARSRAAHGSRVIAPHDNAVARLAAAVARIAQQEWPVQLNRTTTAMVEAIAGIMGVDPVETAPDELVLATGKSAGFLTASLRTTSNPTMLQAGYKHNVIPESATVAIDVRPFPGEEQQTLDRLRELAGPDIEFEITQQDIGTEADPASPIVTAAAASLRRFDSEARVVPYFLSGGTDNKSLATLGIAGFGFAPLKLPPELDFPGMFHGVDERVPLDALVFGREVLKDFLLTY